MENNSNITSTIITTINTILQNLFSSIDNNLYEILDDITFISSDIINESYFENILGTSASNGILLISLNKTADLAFLIGNIKAISATIPAIINAILGPIVIYPLISAFRIPQLIPSYEVKILGTAYTNVTFLIGFIAVL